MSKRNLDDGKINEEVTVAITKGISKLNNLEGVSKNARTLVIGVGAGGNAQAAEATPFKYTTLGVNTTDADYAGLNLVHKYAVTNGQGSGQERKIAKTLFKEDFAVFGDMISNTIDMDNIDNIFVAYTTGGGSGSGIGPALAKFMVTNYGQGRNVIALVTVSDIRDHTRFQENTRDCIEETINAGVPYILFDNSLAREKNLNNTYSRVNGEVLDTIRVLSREFIEESRNNMDVADMNKLWTTPSRAIVVTGNIDRRMASDKSIEEQIIERVRNSYQIIGQSTKYVRYGIYINLEETYLDEVDMLFPELYEEFGQPYESYRHIQTRRTDEKDGVPDFFVVISNMAEPVERYELVMKRISEFANADNNKASISSVKRVELDDKDGTADISKSVKRVKSQNKPDSFDMGAFED